MKGVNDNKKIFLGFLLVSVVLISCYFFFVELYPQKSNTDLWTHLAIINELKADTFTEINAPFYPEGNRDPRGGSYLAVVAIVSKALEVSTINTYLFFGIINVIFFLVSAIIFSREFFSTRRATFLFPILLLFLWGPSKNIAAGMFSLNEVLWMGPFLHFFMFGCIMLTIVFLQRFLKTEKITKRNFFTALLLTYIVWNSHILSGGLLFVVIGTYVAVSFFKYHKSTKKLIYLALIPVIVVLINFIWPLYNQMSFIESQGTFITQVNPVVVKGSVINYWGLLKMWAAMAGFSLLGLFMLIRKKKYIFFFSLFIVVSLIILSGLTPISIRFYWRFFPLLVFSGTAGWAIFFSRQRLKIVMIVTTLLIIIGAVFTKNKILTFNDWDPYTYQQSYYIGSSNSFDIVSSLPSSSVIFTDEIESHILSGLTGYNVVGVRPKHASFTQSAKEREGYNDIKRAYENPEYILSVIEHYKVSHILLKNRSEKEDMGLSEYVSSHFSVAERDKTFTLYSVQ